MPGDESEKFDHAALPRRQRAVVLAHETSDQGRRGARCVGRCLQGSKPRDDMRFRSVRWATVPKSIFGQAARINPLGIVWRAGTCRLLRRRAPPTMHSKTVLG